MGRSVGVMFKELMSHLFKKPATVLYPLQRLDPPERFRGRLIWDDTECIRCSMCVRDCPCDVLELVERDDGSVDDKGKPVRDLVAIMKRCIFCGQCSWVCPKDALRFERVFELAQADKNGLRMYVENHQTYEPPPVAEAAEPAPEADQASQSEGEDQTEQ